MNYYGKPDPEDLKPTKREPSGPIGYTEYIEMNAVEMKKFRHLKPITQDEINSVDMDNLILQLQGV